MQCNRSCDQSFHRILFPIGNDRLSPAILQIFHSKHIEVTTVTFQSHATSSSVTRSFDPQVDITYSCSLSTKSVSATVTFQGHATPSSVTRSLDPQVDITYSCSLSTKSVSADVVEITYLMTYSYYVRRKMRNENFLKYE